MLYMKKRPQGAAFIIFVSVIFLFSCNSVKSKNYTITPSIVHFSIDRETRFEATLHIKNLSSEKLYISEIATACGCVAGTLQDSTVFPNDSVSLKVTFTPKPSDTGDVVRFVSVRTDGTPPIKSVELRGKVN